MGYGQDFLSDDGSFTSQEYAGNPAFTDTNYDLTNFDSGGTSDWTTSFSQGTQDLLAGTFMSTESLGIDWGASNSDIIGFLMTEAGAGNESGGVMADLWKDTKEGASSFWTTINDEGNKTGVNLASKFIVGMLSAPMLNRQTKAMELASQAKMLIAQTNAGALQLQQQKLENASSLKNTNFGQQTPLVYDDKLAERRNRNQPIGLIGA